MKLYYNYCSVYKDTVCVSNKPISIRPAFDTYLRRVAIDINEESGVAEIVGDEIQYEFSFERQKINELENEPCESSIRHNKGFSLFGFYFIKPYDYVYGWYALKETKLKKIVMNKYKIETV